MEEENEEQSTSLLSIAGHVVLSLVALALSGVAVVGMFFYPWGEEGYFINYLPVQFVHTHDFGWGTSTTYDPLGGLISIMAWVEMFAVLSLAFLASGGAVFYKKIPTNVTTPFGFYVISYFGQSAYQFDLMFVGIRENGFSLKDSMGFFLTTGSILLLVVLSLLLGIFTSLGRTPPDSEEDEPGF